MHAITNATSLDDLCAAMNEAGAAINDLLTTSEYAGYLIGDYGRAVEDCPVYGGGAPSDTHGVWSWDAERLLVGEGWGSCELVPRDEWGS